MTRYVQDRARSAELLRMTLQRMSEHAAAFNPLAYALWYEHLAGINPRLSHALERRLESGEALDDEAIAELHAAHVAEIDAATAERVGADMRRLMCELSRSAESAGGSAGAMGSHLHHLQQALHEGDPAALAPRIGDALAGAAQLQAAVDALREQVHSSRREIEALRSELDRVREEAVLCPLTGVFNRKGFDARLQAMFGAHGGPPQPTSLLLLDLDHFKQINDLHGHLIGDRVLEATGAVLRRAVADAGEGAVAARYGGEEFAVLLPGRAEFRACELAESVRAEVKSMRIRQRKTDRTVRTVTISIGVATLMAGESAAAFVARADSALYASKRDGRDRVTRSIPCEVQHVEVVGE